MTPNDVRNMAEVIAKAIAAASGADWNEMDEGDRNDFRAVAHAAAGAHDAWLAASGFMVVPPGSVPAPRDRDMAAAMVQAGARFLEKHPAGVVTPPKPKLIMPGSATSH